MTLPKLPKKKKKIEADITPNVMQWFVDNYPNSVSVEVKIKGNKRYSHQTAALKKTQEGVFAHKIRDTGKNPYDFYVQKGADAFTVYVDGRDCTAERIDGEKTFTFTV